MKMRGVLYIAAALAVVMVLSGCKGWRRGRTTADGEIPGVSPVAGTEIGELGLGTERFEGTALDVKFDPVYFDYDSSLVKPEERPKIERVAEYLRQNAQLRLTIEGHCDERGSAEYNLALGERRALAVRAYLTGLGISPDRIQTVSYGEERPARVGTGEEVWRWNRRAEFVVMQ